MLRGGKPMLQDTVSDMTVDCTAACEKWFSDYRDKGGQDNIYLGLRNLLSKSITEDWKGTQPHKKQSHNWWGSGIWVGVPVNRNKLGIKGR